MSSGSNKPVYVVPRYRATGDVPFYHVLHGAVPGHQIDFLYCPEVPQGALTQTHLGHLSRILKYVEPRPGATQAFAFGNLSRDDVQHEPGHGGLALLFAVRIQGVTDHAGRDMLPFAHGLVAIDRALDRGTLLEAATAFRRHLLRPEGARDPHGDFYREYVRTLAERPRELDRFLARSVAAFDDLPRPERSRLSWDFVAAEDTQARRVVIVHDDGEELSTVVARGAAICAVLYRSNIKWTSISTGRDLDIQGGTTVRFVPASEVVADERALVLGLEELPDDEDTLAERLFGARRRGTGTRGARVGWRDGCEPASPLPPASDKNLPGDPESVGATPASATAGEAMAGGAMAGGAMAGGAMAGGAMAGGAMAGGDATLVSPGSGGESERRRSRRRGRVGGLAALAGVAGVVGAIAWALSVPVSSPAPSAPHAPASLPHSPASLPHSPASSPPTGGKALAKEAPSGAPSSGASTGPVGTSVQTASSSMPHPGRPIPRPRREPPPPPPMAGGPRKFPR